uniref:phosphoribosylformylglycinamidine cyclo-ligase n=1 Tax=Ditylenchus dipsaci TaxID=166011 RepID=A0A915DUF5_9BILA
MSATVRHSSLGVPGSKLGAATVYVREREFANEEDFNQWFKDEKVNWRNPHTRDLSANKTEEYQCRYASMKNYRCSIKLRVLYPQDNFKVIVEQSKGSHDHVPVSQPKLSDQHKELMKQELDSTALIIQGKIQKTRRMGNDPLPPSIKQINSFKYRQKKEGIILSIEQLKTYAEANSRVPEEDDDKSFVCAFASSIIDQKQVFCLTWTTQKLRRMQHLSKVIQVDATYKLNWHGFPVMVCGFSDAEQHFFATHLALQENRNILDVLAGGVRLQSYIIPSSSALNLSEEELGLMYNELQNNSFVDWKRYELIRHSIRIVRPSTIWPSYDVCNCKEGMKKKLCKHSLVESISEACLESGCAVVGGETAEMPGVYGPNQWDLAGCCVGARESTWPELPLTSQVEEGDVLIGLTSNGLHSNGFSLVRKVMQSSGFSVTDPCPWDDSISLGHSLLQPTKIYVKDLLKLSISGHIKAMAHITGGGILENLPVLYHLKWLLLLIAANGHPSQCSPGSAKWAILIHKRC